MMIRQILERHAKGELSAGIPNPSLQQVCELVAKAATYVTPNVQRKAFKQTGLTLATDGSEDEKELSSNLKDLLQNFKFDLVSRSEDVVTAFFSETKIQNREPPSIAKIFKTFCADAAKAKVEDFHREPILHKMKKDNR